MKIICFTDKDDTEELIKYNTFDFKLEFIDSFDNLPDSDFYIVSLKYGSSIYEKFIDFMRKRHNSTFLFLNEYKKSLDIEDFDIREEKNTEIYMYVPSAALYRIKEIIS